MTDLVFLPSVCQDTPAIETEYLMEDPLPESSNHCDGDETSVFKNLVSPGPEGSASLVGETTDTELTVMTQDKNLRGYV